MWCKRSVVAVGLGLCLATVAAGQPKYKVLIVDGQNAHKWKETTPVLKKILVDSGLFTVDVATAPEKGKDLCGFKPQFAAYDVVVSNYQGMPGRRRRSRPSWIT